jgi:hypothetical protein
MSARKLVEQGTLVEAKGQDGVFPIRIITEGKGSSGTYSRELLEQYGSVFANRAMHMNHPKDPNQPWERDVLGIAARTGEVRVGEDEQGRVALYTEAKVRKEYREFVEEFGDLIGVSIFASGEGREENGEYIVESFDGDDPYTSVDFVVAAGRGGRVEKMMESYRAIETSAGKPADDDAATASVENKEKENKMDAELKALIEAWVKSTSEKLTALEAKIDSVVTLSEQATQAAADKTDAFQVADEVSKAVAEAKLPEEGRKRVIESVKAGNPVAEAVSAEVAYVKAITESVAAIVAEAGVQGRIVENAGTAGFSFADLGKATR